MNDWMPALQEAFSQLHWTEVGAVVFGLAYVIFAANESVWCWVWGAISCSLWAWSAFFLYDLFIDAGLQLFYVGISFVGIWQWLRGGAQEQVLDIQIWPWKEHLIWGVAGLLLSFLLGFLFASYTQAAATYWDALTTVFSVIATIMVVQKVLENWVYWIVLDAIYIFLYGSRGSVLFPMLFALYLVIAIFGLIAWYKKWKLNTKSLSKI